MANVDILKNAEEMMAPARQLNELALSNFEKLVDLQLENARKYASVALDSMKAAAAVKDAEGAKDYLTKQADAARKAAEDMVADSKMLVQMGQDYSAEVQKILQAGFEKATKKA